MARSLQRAQRGVFNRLTGLFIDDVEDVWQETSHRFSLRPAGERLGNSIEKGDPPFGVGADHPVTDAGQSDPQPLRLLPQRLFGAPMRQENALRVLQGNGLKLRFLVVPWLHDHPSFSDARRGAFHARPDLCKCLFAAGRRVVAEGREAAIVTGPQLPHGDVCGGLEDAVANLVR